MTHEQKPESAEFRTREDQYNDPRFKRELECEIHIATGCRVTLYAEERPTGLAQCSTYDHWVGHWSTPNWRYPVTRFVSVEEMERAVSEAEARGAAEQRRKDAEGAVAWVDPTFLPSSDYPWMDARLLLEDGTKGTIPLYTRPANVAALEARVKELEGERERIATALDGVAKQIAGTWSGHISEESIAIKEACAARIEQEAAAIREGGE